MSPFCFCWAFWVFAFKACLMKKTIFFVSVVPLFGKKMGPVVVKAQYKLNWIKLNDFCSYYELLSLFSSRLVYTINQKSYLKLAEEMVNVNYFQMWTVLAKLPSDDKYIHFSRLMDSSFVCSPLRPHRSAFTSFPTSRHKMSCTSFSNTSVAQTASRTRTGDPRQLYDPGPGASGSCPWMNLALEYQKIAKVVSF